MLNAQYRPMDFAGVVSAQRTSLSEIIDIEFGLLRELLALHVLNYQQVEIIQHEKVPTRQVNKLLDYVTNFSKAKQKNFLLALYRTGQIHVNNFIMANGHRTPRARENWPLLADHKKGIICTKLPELTRTIDTENGLLDEMLSNECINEEHKQIVEVQNTNAKRNETLLRILVRRSVGDYNKFVECLVKTKQFQVAYLL